MTDISYAGSEPLMLTLCLEEDSILVSKAILEALEHPRQVQMLINEDRERSAPHPQTRWRARGLEPFSPGG